MKKCRRAAHGFIRTSVIATIIVCAPFASAQPKAKAKAAQQASAVTQPAVAQPTGPTGIGALKLGIDQDTLEALKSADGIYLLEPLTIDVQRTEAEQNALLYKARIMTPLSTDSAPARFTFTSGRLAGFTVDLDENQFQQAMSQLQEKYGHGSVTDDRKDEQCIYHNGASFKVNSGAVSRRWIQRITDTEHISATIVEFTVDICPPSLLGPRIGPQTSRFISFYDVHSDANPKPNPF
ncbi:hypothetical protein [Paraburkholderia sp. BCC1885]|uniref:hypothetical protein n=1 Tax=Paraburkholderia sp. BCC1885 TaxID=2562669 RepID=UPI0011841952|nr:hypothetical protein [Paraburkholderia sp. BCC1885]